MIDTDKYEGHTPAEHWDFSTWGITMPTGFDADARLIADAPLLLEEVKRLREENERLREFVENIEWGLDEINKEYKEIKKVIE